MSFQFKFSTVLLITVFLAVNAKVHAAGWRDDFNDGNVLDGNPVMWSQLDVGGHLPGTYDASSGDYRLWTPGDNGNTPNTQTSWVDDVSFTDSYVRAQAVVLPTDSNGNLLLLARINTSQKNAYILALDSAGELDLQIVLFGFSVQNLVPTVTLRELNAKSDVVFELDVLADPSINGNRLYGYVWRPGNPKPTTPQIEAADSDYAEFVLQGPAGIGFSEATDHLNDNTSGLFRYAQAQDSPFLEGDYNGDGLINAADYVVWRKNSGEAAGYAAWRPNFGQPSVGTGSAIGSSLDYNSVPEPTITLQLTLALLFVARKRRSQMMRQK